MHIVNYVLVLVFVLASSVNASPTQQQLLDYIGKKLPAHMSVDAEHFRYKAFPGTHRGRVSVAGRIFTNVNLLELAVKLGFGGEPDRPALRQAVLSKGYNQSEFNDAFANVLPSEQGMLRHMRRYPNEYRIVNPVGAWLDFDGELFYLEGVDGFKIDGRMNFPQLRGTPPSAINGAYYIAGSEEFQNIVARFVDEIERQRASTTSSAKVTMPASAPKVAFADPEFQEILQANAWSGPVNQGGQSFYSVEITPNFLGFEVEYPELKCGGLWSLHDTADGAARLTEKITFGSGCGNGGRIILTLRDDGNLDFKWQYLNSERVCCTGTLVPKLR